MEYNINATMGWKCSLLKLGMGDEILSDTAKGAALTGSHRNGNNLGSEGFNVIVSDLSGHNNLRPIVILAEVSLG